jgi:hypothetical protein
VDNWLVGLGRFVFEPIKFELALADFDFEVTCPTITTDQSIDVVPAVRNENYLVPVGDKLEWFPPSEIKNAD